MLQLFAVFARLKRLGLRGGREGTDPAVPTAPSSPEGFEDQWIWKALKVALNGRSGNFLFKVYSGGLRVLVLWSFHHSSFHLQALAPHLSTHEQDFSRPLWTPLMLDDTRGTLHILNRFWMISVWFRDMYIYIYIL